MITDLHIHYPMHLVHEELEPNRKLLRWWDEVKGELLQQVFDLAAHFLNDPDSHEDWRVDLAGLREGGVGTACSVLYWPPSELIPSAGTHPEPASFEHLVRQLDDVERHLEGHVIVRAAEDLARGELRFVHCVEGGFHLGPDKDEVCEHVAELARRGVLYITLAHLFFCGVAANAPAIPLLSEEAYNALFPQEKGIALTELGEAAVAAMVEHRIAVDVSHMRQDALDETFRLLNSLDPRLQLPVLASHVAVRSAGPHDQSYNISPSTMESVRDRDGVIGLILAEHQMGASESEAETREVIRRHIQAIHDVLGNHAHTAIGSDFDGFIKPTLHGLQHARDLRKLEDWIRVDFPDAADGILHANADRVIRRVFALRGA